MLVRRTDKSERVWRSALPDITAAITTLRLLRFFIMVVLFMMVRMMSIYDADDDGDDDGDGEDDDQRNAIITLKCPA